eukprot:XP_011662869.1 PREDICTED: tripartite motif containing 13-like [Strongylocentrotus purpuratus]
MTTSLKQAVHKNLECPVCLSFFKDPRILNCSHTFCKGCLETTLLESRWNTDVLLCPMCRGETSVPGGDVGRLQSNITVRSLVEDVKTQAKVCSRGNQEDKSLERKWSKCKKYPNYEEEYFCLNCNKYICCKCAISEHVKNAQNILEAGAYETEQKNNVDELASKVDAKIRNVEKYVSSVVDQRKKVHNVQKQRKDEIDETFEKFVQILKERKTVLTNEVEHGQLGKLKTSFGDMEESSRKQIYQIKKALDLVKNGLNFPLQTEALTSHKAECQQLEEFLSRIGPDEELPIRIAEEGERISFTSQGSEELQLGQLQYMPKISASPFGEARSAIPFGEALSVSPFGEAQSVISLDEARSAIPFREALSASPFGEPQYVISLDEARSAIPFREALSASPFGEPQYESPFGEARSASPCSEARSVSPFGEAQYVISLDEARSAIPFREALSASPFGEPQYESPFGEARSASPFGEARSASPFGEAREALKN